MSKTSSSSRRQRPVTPPELKIDREEPDWDYSYVVSSRGDWDYSCPPTPVDRDVDAFASPSQMSRRSRESKVSSRKSRRSSVRKDKALLDQTGMGNLCVTPACSMEQPEEHSLFFQTFPDSLERSIKRPQTIHHRMDRSIPGAVIARKAKNQSHEKKGRSPVVLRAAIPDDSSWSSIETGAASTMEPSSFVTRETSLPPPGCAFTFPFLASAPLKKDDCSQASPTSVTDIVGDLEELQDQLEALRTTSPQQIGGCKWSPSTSSTSSGSTSARSQLAVNKVANYSRKRMDQLDEELQDRLEALRITPPQQIGGCKWSPSTASTSSGSTSARSQLAVNKVANYSRTRMDQLDAFLMAKSSGRDSPEALRLAYSSVFHSPQTLQKECLEKPEPPVEEEDEEEDEEISRAYLLHSPHKSWMEKPEPPVEEEKEECPDTSSTTHSLASFHTFRTAQDRASPDTVPPAPPSHRPPPRKSVCFAEKLVTHVMHRPKTLPEENEQLYFSKEELQELERDRLEQIYEEQFETIHKKGSEVVVTFPVPRVDFPPPLMDVSMLTDASSSFDSEDGLMEI